MTTSLRVHEVFLSFEGEGVHIGKKQVFVRLQGCKVGCRWCDTPEASPLEGGYLTDIPSLLDKVISVSTLNVSITGGDPLLQAEALIPFVVELKQRSRWINIEIPGVSLSIEGKNLLRYVDFISADIKTPSSGVSFDLSLPYRLYSDFYSKISYKAVIKDNQDLDFLLEHYQNLPIVLTPEGSRIKEVVKLLLERRYPSHWRVIPQMHKLLGID